MLYDQYLPLLLRKRMLHQQALQRAIEQGFICISAEGRLVWVPENRTMLAYFCGRLWCGDRPVYNRRARGNCWEKGNRTFPERSLAAVFGDPRVGERRRKRIYSKISEDYQLIDLLFDMS